MSGVRLLLYLTTKRGMNTVRYLLDYCGKAQRRGIRVGFGHSNCGHDDWSDVPC